MSKLENATFLTGDATEKLSELDENSVHVCVTSKKLNCSLIYTSGGFTGTSTHQRIYKKVQLACP
jgi:DNA modification methylase